MLCAAMCVVINLQLPKRVGICRVGDVLLGSRILLLDDLLVISTAVFISDRLLQSRMCVVRHVRMR